MRKCSGGMLDDPPPPRRSRLRSVAAVVAGLALAPLVYEAGLIGVASWRAMSGVEMHVHTPVLDALSARWESAREAARLSLSAVFHDVPWRPDYVLAVAVVWVIAGAYLLRTQWSR